MLMAGLGFYGVVTTPVEWVTAQQPAASQISAAKRAVDSDCINSVLGTGGGEPTAWWQQR